jgi:hypothetical protein
MKGNSLETTKTLDRKKKTNIPGNMIKRKHLLTYVNRTKGNIDEIHTKKNRKEKEKMY